MSGIAAPSLSPTSTSRTPFTPRLDNYKGVFSSLVSETFSLDTKSAAASSSSSSHSPPSPSPVSTYPSSVAEYVRLKGGTHAISKILIANNGIAAVKAMRYIKKWAYETFGNDRIIEFVVMATPEDMKANAAYIHLADEFVEVPGGSNNNNYANVKLITEIAERTGAHAVWAGWGHASENPKLPEALAKTKNGVVWMGPPPSAMRALGDKIGSTLIAQSARVPCLPWSGDGLIVDYAAQGIPKDLYGAACVTSAAQTKAVAEKIGYPCMLKASEGGGGKGIRRVTSAEDIDLAFPQVQGEVPGSPIFLMKLAPVCRHLEVQLLADVHGEAIAIHGRDCSIQRRHQKIIEEGPVVAAPPEVFYEMEQSAVRLAKEVGYIGAGTVEYLYLDTGEYYFLELNPRLQVEHPVTELISGVNLPAAQLQVAMGIPLHLIRGIRRMYGENPDTETRIDFAHQRPHLLPGHVIACRITAENPDNAFQPTSGVIQELNFRSTPDVWGYFSVGARGGVHEFSDSQFGHVFGLGETREIARRNMVLALRELSIRGDIRTTVEYLQKILETSDFKANRITTTWLEKVMAAHAVQTEKPDIHVAVILGALLRFFRWQTTKDSEFVRSLERGQMPNPQIFIDLVKMKFDLIYEKTKYTMTVYKTGPSSCEVQLNNWFAESEVYSLADEGMLVLLDGKKHVVYGQEFPSGLRLTVDGKTCLFSEEYDPTQLRAAMQGKLVRYLARDGAHVPKDKPYAEVEVMKMYVTLVAPESGTLRHVKPEGAVLEPGDLIGTLVLDDPQRVQKAELFTGEFPHLKPPTLEGGNPNAVLKSARRKLASLLGGYEMRSSVIKETLNNLMDALREPRLPVEQFSEQLSTLTGRIPERLYDEFQEIIQGHQKSISHNKFYWETPEQFPVIELQNAIDKELISLESNPSARLQLTNHLSNSGVTQLLQHYKEGNHTYAASILIQFIEDYVDVEQHFTDSRPEFVIKALRRAFSSSEPNSISQISRLSRAHFNLAKRNELMMMLFDVVETQLSPLMVDFTPSIRLLTAKCHCKDSSAVLLRARQLLMRQAVPSSQQRKIGIQTILQSALAVTGDMRRERMATLIDQSGPIEDLIFGFFETRLAVPAMEAYIRRVYQVYAVYSVDVKQPRDVGALRGKWEFCLDSHSSGVIPVAMNANGSSPIKRDASSQQVTLLQQHRYAMKAAESMTNIASLNNPRSPTRSSMSFVSELNRSTSNPSTQSLRQGVMAFFKDFDALKKGFEEALSEFNSTALLTEPIHVLYVGCKWASRTTPDDSLSEYFRTLLKAHESELSSRFIRRVSFFVTAGKDEHPMYFTFRHRLQYEEDPVCRHIEPSYAVHLQLQRLRNFDIRFIPTQNRMVHLFAAYPAAKSGEGKALIGVTKHPLQERPMGPKHDGRRLFVRCVIRTLDASQQYDVLSPSAPSEMDLDAYPDTEVGFVEALNAIEMAMGTGDSSPHWKSNSIFLNVVVEAVVEVEYIVAVIRMMGRRYGDKIQRLNVTLVEFACSIKSSAEEETSTPYRFVCSNPTGHSLIVECYEERKDIKTGKIILRYRPTGAQKRIAEMSPTELKPNGSTIKLGALDGNEIYTPYPIETTLQRQRETAALLETVYIYDFIALFETALSKMWRNKLKGKKETGIEAILEEKHQDIPIGILSATELVLIPNEDPLSMSFEPYKLVPLSSPRECGTNDIGMVVWIVTAKTLEYPQGRQFILIGNDITFQAGTFGPKEDFLFYAASKLSRQMGIPRIYLAANSGARIGLADEIRSKFRVAFIDDDAKKGVAYLWLSEEDFTKYRNVANVTKVDVKGEVRYQIIDIIGQKDGLGVENLRGSGLIAGETSLAYQEIFTLTYATGRTVGIGAYLARLGQRCIQKANPPASIILTGFNALNKLLGRAVYSSNVQLGGPDIMYTNGVTHLTVSDDLQGVQAILQWMSFVPSKRFEIFPSPPSSSLSDAIGRLVEFKVPKTPYDPRLSLTGHVDDSATAFVSGFFDKDSFVEILSGWARSVIVGRARLGGIPIGVVAVETRTVEQVIPADPASSDSKEQIVQRAGGVWYPDSAFKTASGIHDMICEDLPLIVFANWRGFSGGMRDMFEEVLKFGSLIVDSLREFSQPIVIYLPPNSTLRGGAWVVVDPTINARYMEMFADASSRGGVLETEGTLDVRFRRNDIVAQCHRLDSQLTEMDQKMATCPDDTQKAELKKAISKREEMLFPLYYSAASLFADLHDTPGRMKAKGCIESIVKWETSREFFFHRINRRRFEQKLWSHQIKLKANVKDFDWRAAQRELNSILIEKFGVAPTDIAADSKVADVLQSKFQQIIAAVEEKKAVEDGFGKGKGAEEQILKIAQSLSLAERKKIADRIAALK